LSSIKAYWDYESIGSLRNEKTDGATLGFPGQEIEIHADHLSGKLTDSATVLDLIQFVKPATIVDEGPYRETNHVGITRVAFEVDDTDAIYEKLRTRGDIEFLSQLATVRSPTKGSLRILTFKDLQDNFGANRTSSSFRLAPPTRRAGQHAKFGSYLRAFA